MSPYRIMNGDNGYFVAIGVRKGVVTTWTRCSKYYATKGWAERRRNEIMRDELRKSM